MRKVTRSWSRRSFLSLLPAPVLLRGGSSPSPLFQEVSETASGIRWKHENAMSRQRHLPETMGPGVAFLDYDNDGWMDIYLVNSGPCDFYRPRRPLANALYHNNRDGTFTDVTGKAGVGGDSFGMGVAVGDYDNDGYPDLFVTAYGSPTLYRNNCDGTFTDVTAKAGLAAPGWTTSAAWFDYDNDGRLDLFVCSFVNYSAGDSIACGSDELGRSRYCNPRMYPATACRLFHNNGDGSFTQVSDRTVIQASLGKALGVVAADIDNDGWMDLFVANDTEPNFLLANRGQNQWEEVALWAEVAYGLDGGARSGMGVDSADWNGDGWMDLFVANVDHEPFSLYRNEGGVMFFDEAFGNDLGRDTYLMSGWGCRFFDFDNDGELDLVLANGHPDDRIEASSSSVQYCQPLMLYRREEGRMNNISKLAGPAFAKRYAARGLAIGDFDNDGRLDVLVGVNGGTPVLLRNQAGHGNHWAGFRLRGVNCNRDAIGARITWSAGGVRRSRQKTGGGSYLSSHDPREVIGIGEAETLDWVEIHWPAPSERIERFENPPVDRYTDIEEGRGRT